MPMVIFFSCLDLEQKFSFTDGRRLNLDAWFKDVLSYRVNNDIADRIKKKGNTHDVLPLRSNCLYA